MKRTIKYVALDVHQATTVASVRDQSGGVIARSILPTDGTAIVEYVGGMRGAVHVAFEEGTQAQWLYDLLDPVADRVIVCDRRGERRRGNKADKVDADELSRRLLRGDLRPVYHGGGTGRACLREFTRAYLNVVEDSTRAMLRLKAIFRGRGIRTGGQRIYNPENRAEWLAKLPAAGARFRAELLLAELDVLRDLRPRAKAAMVREARFASRSCWPPCRRLGASARSEASGPTAAWPSSPSPAPIMNLSKAGPCAAAARRSRAG
jgi:hypothetical protein